MKLRTALLALVVALVFGACQGKVSVEKDKDGSVKVKVDNKKTDSPETRFKKAVDALELKATQTPALKAGIDAKVATFKADFEKVKADPAALNTLITRVESYSKELAAAPAAPAAGGKLGTAAPTAPPVGGKLGGPAPVGTVVAPAGTVPGGKLGGAATPPVGGKLGGAPAGTTAPAGNLPGGTLGGAAPPAGGSKLGGAPAPAGGTPAPAGGMGGK